MKKVMLSASPSVEPLEARIAPAAVFTFTDVDGDEVKITTSKGSDAALAEVISPFLVDSGSGKLLQKLDLAANPVFKGTNLTITATGSGDGSVDIGYINATGIDLGRVSISGDVGQIDAGDGKLSTAAIKSLEVGSLGAKGVTTQDASDASLVSTVNGPLPSFIAHGDVKGTLTVTGGAKGRINTIEIDGSLAGGDQQLAGSISVSGAVGKVLIHGKLEGGSAANTGFLAAASLKSITVEKSIIGGDGEYSGSVKIRGNIGQLLVNENITGGSADTAHHSGEIRAGGVIKNTRVIGQLAGGAGNNSGAIGSGLGLDNVTIENGVVGGDGFESGTIGSTGKIGKVVIGTQITGGGGEKSGAVLATARIEKVIVNGDITGGEGTNSGVIATDGGLGSVDVTGSVKGGNGEESGAIGSKKSLTSVSISGDLEGGGGFQSGVVVSSSSIGTVNIGGSVIGGSNTKSGAIGAFGAIGLVKIGGDLQGMGGINSGAILSASLVSRVEISGSIQGGNGVRSGVIDSAGFIGSVTVEQDVRGGSEFEAGSITADRGIQRVEIGGSLIGGSQSSTGLISTPGVIGSVVIGHNLEGGTSFQTGALEAFRINNVLIGNDIVGSTGTLSGVILATAPPSADFSNGAQGARAASTPEAILGSIKVLGDVIGGEGPESGAIISEGRITSIAIGRPGVIIDGEQPAISPVLTDAPAGGIGSLVGGTGFGSGSITARGDIGTITVARDVIGGIGNSQREVSAEENSGRIFSGGNIQKLTIGHDLIGGESYFGNSSEGGPSDAGQVYARGRIGAVDIGGSMRGGFGEYSATVRAGTIDSVRVGGNVVAGVGAYSASLTAEVLDIKAVKIAGEITTNTGIFNGEGTLPGGFNSASIAAARNLGRIEIGSIDGQFDAHVSITAVGQVGARNDAQALAIASITVHNASAYADILAGYDNASRFAFRLPVNPDAQIGTVTVGFPEGGESVFWQYTNVVAGAEAGSDGVFGSDDDAVISNPDASSKVISKIARVVIYGSDFFSNAEGIVAEQVGSVLAVGEKVPLKAGPKNDFITLRTESGLTVNEPTGIPLPRV